MLSIENALTTKYPAFQETPWLLKVPALGLLKRLFREKSINRFLQEHTGVEGLDFIDKVLEYFNLGYAVSNLDRENIPSTGRVIIFANHPLGALDGLCLLKLVSEVRPDVKIVANDMLMQIDPVKRFLLPVDAFSSTSKREQLQAIQHALEQEHAVIFFPAGEVSRVRPQGVRDTRWSSGFVKFALRAGAPLLPCYIDARNSALFYGVSTINKPAASLLLVQEMFGQAEKTLPIRFGQLIPAVALQHDKRSRQIQVKRFKHHLYRVAKGKTGVFPVEQAIAHPESAKVLKKELEQATLLGQTADGKQIYLIHYQPESAVMRELGRLREVSFRKVGEGSGKRRDLDLYDQTYSHLVLWDDSDLEIVGAYRVKKTNGSSDSLYTASLFDFQDEFSLYLANGLELGRSFVQPKYWGSRALEYLWQGIGAYLRHHPEVRYLFGPVSISNAYPKGAINLLVEFYSQYFSMEQSLAAAQQPFCMTRLEKDDVANIFSGSDYKTDLKTLKDMLRHFSVSIPTLYKQYAEVFEPEGVKYLAWNVDLEFGACVDGLLLTDLNYMKAARRKRYIGEEHVDAARAA